MVLMMAMLDDAADGDAVKKGRGFYSALIAGPIAFAGGNETKPDIPASPIAGMSSRGRPRARSTNLDNFETAERRNNLDHPCEGLEFRRMHI
jgi:hypothetical protein